MEELNQEMVDILEVESINDEDLLENYDEWDSLARLSLLSFIDTEYSVNLFQPDISGVKTLADIKKIVKSKQ